MHELLDYIRHLVASGGPEPHQYDELNDWFHRVAAMVGDGEITLPQVKAMWPVFGDAFSPQTLQGFVVHRPHGYAGDFEIIDRIHTHWLSPVAHLRNWDHFFHWHQAPRAVRNRKDYFKSLMAELDASGEPQRVLNVGSGPCRDVHEYLQEHPASHIHFECIEQDEKAIAYARALLGDADVTIHEQDAFRFKPGRTRYDLVWSAGLFDYLDDRQFVLLLKVLARTLRPGGELVIGNFTEPNHSRAYMEFGGWFLNHRSEAQLRTLVALSTLACESVSVEQEPAGLNLFLRIRMA
ncbi:hypothetical protein D3C78_292070 [compost metagenome]